MAGGRARRSASPPRAPQTSRRGGRGAATSARAAAAQHAQMPAIAEGSSQQPTTGGEQPDPDIDVDTSDPEVVRARTSREGDFSRIVDTARASPERQRVTRSRREESAGPAPPPTTRAPTTATAAAAASAAAADARSSRRAAHARGMTPEDQLQQDLHRASAEPESPTIQARQQESSQQDVSSSSVQEQSSVSWITERGLQQPELQRARRERQHSPLRRSQRQQQPQAQAEHNAGGGDIVDAPGPSTSRRAQRSVAAAPAPAPAASATPDESSEDSAGPPTDRSGNTAMSNNPVQNAPVLHPTSGQTAATVPRVVTKREDARTAPAPSSGAVPPVTAAAAAVETIGRQRTKLTSPIVLTIMLLGLSALLMLAAFQDNVKSLSPRLPRLPFSICGGGGGCGKQIPISYGSSADATEALEKLSSAFDSKLADMANDVTAAKAEMDRKLADIPQVSPNPMAAMRVNFFSTGTGAIVDPYLTSPTMQPPASFAQRVFGRMVGVSMACMAPVAALKPWQDIGECWCASGSRPQLAVLLGYPIVPEEVVVEHIPKDETLDPTLAPQEMELWAEFSPMSTTGTGGGGGGDSPTVAPFRSRRSEAAASASSSSSQTDSTRRTSSSNGNPRSQQPSLSSSKSLDSSAHEYLLSTLRMTYPGEPDSAFSDNPRLGPNYFRLGKWRYDIHRSHNVQRFRLDAVVDIPGYRVKKAIVRTTSNWGGSHTCLYRVRLHGQA